MRYRILFLYLALMVSASCTVAGRDPARHRAYPRSYEFYDLKFSWETTRKPTGITISGIVRNQSYYYLSDLELTASLTDAKGNIMAERTFFFPHTVSLDETIPFNLQVPLSQGQPAEKIKFFYRYRLSEEKESGTPRFHSFEGGL